MLDPDSVFLWISLHLCLYIFIYIFVSLTLYPVVTLILQPPPLLGSDWWLLVTCHCKQLVTMGDVRQRVIQEPKSTDVLVGVFIGLKSGYQTKIVNINLQ